MENEEILLEQERKDADVGILKEDETVSVSPNSNDSPNNAGRSRRHSSRVGPPQKKKCRISDRRSLRTTDRASTRSSRFSFPFDREESGIFPCPVSGCDLLSKTRNERNYHLRTDHPNYGFLKHGTDKEKEKLTTSVISKDDVGVTLPCSSNTPSSVALKFSQCSSSQDFKKELDYNISEASPDNDYIETDHMLDDLKLELHEDSRFHSQEYYCRKRGRPRNPPNSEPGPNSKIRVSDPTGKYRCYVPECSWRGGYRSIRMDHMRWCHKGWQLPPRYIIQKMSKEGVYIDPDSYVPEYNCLIDGCDWKGNFRASRSSHMRICHPEFQTMRKKAPAGGFVADGKYECHVADCGWRGASRSTRAHHIQREHPGFINPIYSNRSLPCAECDVHVTSHKAFVDHMVLNHCVGGLVHREFIDVRDYEEWFDAVQESFSVEFIKRMGVKQTENYQVLYLYCSRSCAYKPKSMRSTHYVSEFIRRRPGTREPYGKCGANCAAYLRVVHWIDGRLSVDGCVEHSGHRLGTPLLRLSNSEREVMDDYLYICDEDIALDLMIAKLRDNEGFLIEGYDVTPDNPYDLGIFVMDPDDEIKSISILIENSIYYPPGSTFNVNLLNEQGEPLTDGLTLGVMTEEMKTLWRSHSSKVVCFEEVRLMLSIFDVAIVFVLVFDDTDTPRCACVYISQDGDKNPMLQYLKSIHCSPIETIVSDTSNDWPTLLDNNFGDAVYNTDLQLAEWHLLADWAQHLDILVRNRVDRFAILCILTRWVRTSDPSLFESIVVDMFDAFREMELDELTQLLDAQLTDPDFSKRWTPLSRNPLTEHGNPLLEMVVRIFRERYLSCEMCTRLDEYIGLLPCRIAEFNAVLRSNVIHTGAPEQPRHVAHIYEDIDPNNVLADGTVVSHIGNISRDSNIPKNEVVDVVSSTIVDSHMGVEEEEIVEELIIECSDDLKMADAYILHADIPSTSHHFPGEMNRKNRIDDMMMRIRHRYENIENDRAMELVENSLTRVVEQLESGEYVLDSDQTQANFMQSSCPSSSAQNDRINPVK